VRIFNKFWGFALWVGLALVGQAAALRMIDAGPRLHYQHYLSLGDLYKDQPVFLAVISLQAICVIVGLLRRRKTILRWTRENFRTWQIIFILVIFFITNVALSRSISDYISEIILAFTIQLINLGNFILIASTIPLSFQSATGDWLTGKKQPNPRFDKFALLGVIWVFGSTAFLSRFVYQAIPHVTDEIIYQYQARYLADGRLSTPAYPVPAAFSQYMIPYNDDQWYSPFPPGWPALLAVGTLLRIDWMINPILAATNVLLFYLVVKDLYNQQTARMSLLLLCISPWFLFMGMNMMSHTSMLTATLLACLGIMNARKKHPLFWALIAGLAAGSVCLIRLFDGLILLVLLGLWALGLGGKRLKPGAIMMFILGAGIMGISVVTYNFFITGQALVFPLTKFYSTYFGPKTYSLGFGPDRGIQWAIDPYPGYSPIEAVINGALNLFSLNIELFGWGFGSLLFILIFLVSNKKSTEDYLLIVFILSVIGSYALFWYSGGPDFGPRYWFITIIAWVILTARGLQTVSSKLSSKFTNGNIYDPRLTATILILCAFTMINYIPWRAIDKYYHYLGMRPDIKVMAENNEFGKSLVFIQGNSHPDYASAWIFNPLDPQSPATIYAHDLDQETRLRVLRAFPGRPVWFIEGPSITQGSYRLITGPINANDAIDIKNTWDQED
jgi:hypothetical protein